jgi:hypothetical protein
MQNFSEKPVLGHNYANIKTLPIYRLFLFKFVSIAEDPKMIYALPNGE